MRLAPVSADLLIKLALVAAALGAVWYVARKVGAVSGAAADAVGSAAAAVGAALDPTSSTNLGARSVNAVGAAVSGDPSFDLGSWVYDVINPDPIPGLSPVEAATAQPDWTGSVTGGW